MRREQRSALGITDDTCLIVNVGRFSPEKGQMLLLEAYAQLVASATTHRTALLMAGDGPTLGTAIRYVADHRLPAVYMPGRTNQVQALLAAADIFVMPSSFEGMPNAMMEAMAHGLPCVSGDRSGAVDIARPEREALYFPTGDATTLARQLARLIDAPALRAELGAAARQRIGDFSVGRMVARFNRILDKELADA